MKKNRIIYLTAAAFGGIFAASGILYGCGGAASGNTAETEPEKYSAIKENNIDNMLRFIAGGKETDPAAADLKTAAEKYLADGGMADEEIKLLQEKICR